MNLNTALKRIYDTLKLRKILESNDIKVNSSPEGITLSLKSNAGGSSGASSSSSILCKITGGTTADGYTVDLYENGLGETSTGAGTADALPLAINSNLPVGYPLVLTSSNVAVTGGND